MAVINSGANSDWWIGQDNNVYQNSATGVQNKGAYISSPTGGYEAQLASGVGTQIQDWNQPTTNTTGTYSGDGDGGAAAAPQSR